jgi:hypothetical protein
MRSFRPLAALCFVSLLLVGAGDVGAQCITTCAPGANPCVEVTNLCEPGANPCTVASNVNFSSGDTTCDLGGRALSLPMGRQIKVNGVGKLVVLNAGGISLATNAKIFANGGGLASGVTLRSLAGITMGSGTRIDASSSSGFGSIELTAFGGDVIVQGQLAANNDSNPNSDGGFLTVTASGSVELGAGGSSAVVDVSGGNGSFIFGGTVEVVAGGSITLRNPLNARGQEGGSLRFDAGVDVRTTAQGDIDVSAMSLAGGGGAVDMTALRDIVLEGDVVSTTSGLDDGSAGLGGDVTLTADGAVTLAAKIDASGGTAGDGGSVSVEAGTVATIGGSVSTRSSGAESAGGPVDVASAGAITVNGTIDSRGGWFAGDIDVSADGAATLAATSVIRADASATNNGGQVKVTGCTLTMQPGAQIRATGDPTSAFPFASIVLQGSSTMTIGGSLMATSANRIVYRDVVPVVTGTSTPQRELVHDPNLPCCVGCPVPTTTTTLATTTTTSTTTTSTTTAPSTTSTSTTLAPTTTTTTTTSTTLAPTTTTTTTTTSTTLASTTTTSTTTSTLATTTTTSTTTSTLATTTTTTSTTTPTTTTTSSTSTTSTTASTTSTSAPTTTTTSTSSTTTTPTTAPTTSTLAPTTTTTSAPLPTTTTTVAPTSCLELPLAGYDAVGCRLDLVAATFLETPAEALGGPRTVKKLSARVARVRKFVQRAHEGRKVTPSLKRAGRELKALARALAKGERKGKIAPAVATPLVALVTRAESDVVSLRAALP